MAMIRRTSFTCKLKFFAAMCKVIKIDTLSQNTENRSSNGREDFAYFIF